MRKYLEQEMLADALKGRIRYGCTTYNRATFIFEVCIDGEQVKRFSLETLNTYFIERGLKQNNNPYGAREYWDDFNTLYCEYSINERPEHTDYEFCEALKEYRQQSIQDSLDSGNPLVKMFAILDRRVGKRTLEKIKTLIVDQPKWLQKFYLLRLNAEKII